MADKQTEQIVAEALAQERRRWEEWDAHCRVPDAEPGYYNVNDGHACVCRFKCSECGEDHRVTPDPVEGTFAFQCACSGDEAA
jgi:hypothetical protein